MKSNEFVVENDNITYKVASPNEVSSKEMNGIIDLISSGQEVAMDVVKRNLTNAASISYASDKGIPIGVIVLKNPITSYRQKVFNNAGVSNLEKKYNLEVGYAYVKPDYRTQGVALRIWRTLLRSNSSSIFATTREKNSTVNRLLQFFGFKQLGKSWKSDRGNYKLLLWARD